MQPKFQITYAQNREDLILAGILRNIRVGFYVDVGANHPEAYSVTKLFYDRGWSGINIEPNERLHRELAARRPRDVNICAGLSSQPGTLTFRAYALDGMSTFSQENKDLLQSSGLVTQFQDSEVEVTTLLEVLRLHRPAGEIHFLKIDVEGLEMEVLQGGAWDRYRPWILCIESSIVRARRDAAAEFLAARNYAAVFFDGINEYFVASERREVWDNFSYVRDIVLAGEAVPSRYLTPQVLAVAGDNAGPAAVADVDELLTLDADAFVTAAYNAVLRRAPDPDGLRNYVQELSNGVSKLSIVTRLRNSEEGRRCGAHLLGYRTARVRSWLGLTGAKVAAAEMTSLAVPIAPPSPLPSAPPPPVIEPTRDESKVVMAMPRNRNFLAPADLEISDVGPKSVLLVGACFLFEWGDVLQKLGYGLAVDRLLFFYLMRLPQTPPKPFEAYDVQLIQVPLPSLMPEHEYMRLPVNDVAPYEELLETCVGRLDLYLQEVLVWSDRIQTFVMSYLSPQQNLLGRLMPRYDLRNPIHFIERLNVELDRLLRAYRGVHLIDTDHIASVYGRRFVGEDAFWMQHHGGLIVRADEIHDASRIEKSASPFEVHDAAPEGFIAMVWHEIRAAFRTLKRADEVKMVCVDLDDTLYRGLIGEWDGVDRGWRTAGWPLGLVEVLQYLRRRGVMLAIISKNDEAHVRALWRAMFDEGQLQLEDFAIIKINRRPKAENIAEALAEANILPGSVVFLDDNPVERAGVKAAFPEIRVLETSHYRWGRVLGWSAELQVAHITAESQRRTELIQAQVERARDRASLSRDEFLRSLQLKVAIHPVNAISDDRFARAFELINKTNQFNTTGVRWLEKDAGAFFAGGGVWWTFDAVDRYTRYGLIGVVCIHQTQITQFVMSCRVAGLDAELAAFSEILGRCSGAGAQFEGSVKETKNNAVSRDIFQRLGWGLSEGRWQGSGSIAMPSHVTVVAQIEIPVQPTMASSSQ